MKPPHNLVGERAAAHPTGHGFWPVIIHKDGTREKLPVNFRSYGQACREAKTIIAQRRAIRSRPR